jgi:hypothetical protein
MVSVHNTYLEAWNMHMTFCGAVKKLLNDSYSWGYGQVWTQLRTIHVAEDIDRCWPGVNTVTNNSRGRGYGQVLAWCEHSYKQFTWQRILTGVGLVWTQLRKIHVAEDMDRCWPGVKTVTNNSRGRGYGQVLAWCEDSYKQFTWRRIRTGISLVWRQLQTIHVAEDMGRC